MIRHFRPFLPLLFLPIHLSPVARSQEQPTPVVTAVRVSTPPRCDGWLTDSVWVVASPATGFRQRTPLDGEPATEKTEIRVLYDDEALYFGCTFFDSSPELIVARLGRRDDEEDADVGSIRIDTFHDHQTAFEFTFNAAGVRTDIIQYDDGNREDASWDAPWEVETRITPEGWTAEVRIPFSILRYESGGEGTGDPVWGINFMRTIHRTRENTRWSHTPRSVSGLISRFGHLEGLRGLPRPRRVEAMPFGILRHERLPATETSDRHTRTRLDGGLDLKVGLSNSFILDATLNPDFGQVEADPAVLNLSTFETFYPEKRPFFVEGTQIFRFNTFGGNNSGPGLFYSRRIGRALGEDRVPLNDGEKVVDVPSSATILGAAKLTGKTAGGLSIGILQGVTGEAFADVDSSGVRIRRSIEPLAHYGLVRLRQDVMDGSSVGGIATSVARQGRAPAFTGGADWNLYWNDRADNLSGFIAGSHVRTSEGELLAGSAGKVQIGRIAAEHWLWSIGVDFTSARYNINDIGFFRRPNDFGGMGSIFYKEEDPGPFLREYRIGLDLHERQNFDGARLIRSAHLGVEFLSLGYWSLDVDLTHDIGQHDDRETRGNGLYGKPRNGSASVGLSSDGRQPVVFGIDQRFSWDAHGRRGSTSEVELEIRPAPWTSWEIGAEVETVNGQEAWVENVPWNGGTASIFGDRDTRAFSAMLRGTVTFTRDITIQMYSQLFAARGHYSAFRRLIGESNFDPYPSFSSSPDFSEQSMQTNVVFRWEYLPGSLLYLVWSHSRSADSPRYDTTLGEELSSVFHAPPANVLMMKASLWWSL